MVGLSRGIKIIVLFPLLSPFQFLYDVASFVQCRGNSDILHIFLCQPTRLVFQLGRQMRPSNILKVNQTPEERKTNHRLFIIPYFRRPRQTPYLSSKILSPRIEMLCGQVIFRSDMRIPIIDPVTNRMEEPSGIGARFLTLLSPNVLEMAGQDACSVEQGDLVGVHSDADETLTESCRHLGDLNKGASFPALVR